MLLHGRMLVPVLLGAGSLLGACNSVPDLRLAPPVQSTDLRGEANDLEARVAVAWRGVGGGAGGGAGGEEPLELRFRLRVENPGETPFTLVPVEFELLDGALASIGDGTAEDLPVAVEAGSSAVFDLRFPVASAEVLEAFDLSSLTLRMSLQAQHWNWSTTFQRVVYSPYDDPWYGPRWGFHAGFGWHH